MTFSKIYVKPSSGVKYNCDVNAKFNGKEIAVKSEQES